MESLQHMIYRKLPPDIKKEIITNPNSYPEYADVIHRLNQESLAQIASKNRDKIRFRLVELMRVLSSISHHIKSHGNMKSIDAWDDFSLDYPEYLEFEYVGKWPKYMLLIYYTYQICYKKWYNLQDYPGCTDIQLEKYVLPLNKNDELINYIYRTYHHLNRNISLAEFRDYGY